jgi:hypothetical protein
MQVREQLQKLEPLIHTLIINKIGSYQSYQLLCCFHGYSGSYRSLLRYLKATPTLNNNVVIDEITIVQYRHWLKNKDKKNKKSKIDKNRDFVIRKYFKYKNIAKVHRKLKINISYSALCRYTNKILGVNNAH